LPSGLYRFHWVLDQHPLDVLAFRTFEGPQSGMDRAWFDPGQHHAALTLGAAWSINGKQRWVGVIVGLRHGMLLQIWRERNALSHRRLPAEER
jgi:hypothetical protein